MADPLSISASIAGLVTLADLIFVRVHKYFRAVKNASKDITKLYVGISDLRGILSNLLLTVEQWEAENYQWTVRLHHLTSCHQTLENLESILNRDETTSLPKTSIETLKRKPRWPFKSSEARELIDEIEQQKATLSLALHVDELSGLFRALSKQDDTDKTIKDINTELKLKREADTRVALDEQREKVLDSFGMIDPRKTHGMNRRLRHPNTGIWLIESPGFQRWLDTDNAQLWLYGIPGAGKTILASLVIDEVLQRSSPDLAAAYFYCDYKNPATHQPDKLLGCLVQQIARQDEQSFAKVESFYKRHSKNSRNPIDYEPRDLRDLIVDLVANYDCTMIVVDGIDECGTHASTVAEFLASLHIDECGTNVKTLLLSRDEQVIRENLEGYDNMSIAAHNRDLSLYVGAEIETRTRKRKLNIKSTDLKDHIRRRLIEGAEGMFRWVTCQLDYLCELPNDAARRNALNDLPRGLVPTYERLLRRVNKSNEEVMALVQKTLRWIAFGGEMTATQLCEAVSIKLGDRCINVEAIPEETEILRWCGSLIRLSNDLKGGRFEFAHFTVKEFLLSIIHNSNGEFAAYSLESKHAKTEIAKVYLTYLNFQEFDQLGDTGQEATTNRLKGYPFRNHIVSVPKFSDEEWDWDETSLFSLAKTMFSPSKPSTLISFAQDCLYSHNESPDQLVVRHGLAEATTLHLAAMLGFAKICKWLAEIECDVNLCTSLGTPLHYALRGTFMGKNLLGSYECSVLKEKTVNVLLKAGADPNLTYNFKSTKVSPLHLAIKFDRRNDIVRQLLCGGATIDDTILNAILGDRDRIGGMSNFKDIMANVDRRNILIQEETRTLALQYAMKNRVSIFTSLFPSSTASERDQDGQAERNNMSLLKAAEFGQRDVCMRLLDEHGVMVDAEEEHTHRTALHYAAMGNQLEICRLLLLRGACIGKLDDWGRTALHYCLDRKGCRSLAFLLTQYPDTTICDNNHRTIWHIAARNHDISALKVLINYCKPGIPIEKLEQSRSNSLVSCAAQRSSPQAEESVLLLLKAGFAPSTTDLAGRTALHLAARAGSSKVVNLLMEHGSDAGALTDDGSNAIHYAMMSESRNIIEVLDILIDKGVKPFECCEGGNIPIQLLFDNEDQRDHIVQEVLQRLVNLPESFIGKKEGLTCTLNLICGYSMSGRRWNRMPTWLKMVLEKGLDPTHTDGRGRTPLEVLTGQVLNCEAYNEVLGEMTLVALDRVPLNEISLKILARSALLRKAIGWSKQKLSEKLMVYYPDVDKVVQGENESLIGYACRSGCSDLLIEKLLERSRACRDKSFGAELVRLACSQNSNGNKRVLMRLLSAGLDPNKPSAKGETPLMVAARTGCDAMVKILLPSGSDPKATDFRGCTVAHYAISTGSFDVLLALRPAAVDWNAKACTKDFGWSRESATVLHLASRLDDDDRILEYLLVKNLIQDIDDVTELNETALFISARRNQSGKVSLLLSHGANPISFHGNKLSPMHIAARHGCTDALKRFIDGGYNLKLKDKEGYDCEILAWKYGHIGVAKMLGQHTREQDKDQDQSRNLSPGALSKVQKALEPLRRAIQWGKIDLCKRIVKDGVDLDVGFQDCSGCTPLIISVIHEQPAIAEYLILAGASPTGSICDSLNPFGFSAFHFASAFNYLGLLKALLEHHSKEYLRLQHAVHPLHHALLHESLDCINLILHNASARGDSPLSDPSYVLTRDQYLSISKSKSNVAPEWIGNFSPLTIAVSTGKHEIVGRLLQLGAPINDGHSFGTTPLHLAAFHGSPDIIELLLKNQADPNALDKDLETSLHIAAQYGNEQATRLLLQCQANPNAQNGLLRTPGMYAARFAEVEIFQILVKGGADPQVKNAYGETCLHYAANSEKADVFLYLLNAMTEDFLGWENLPGCTGLSEAFLNDKMNFTAVLNMAPRCGVYWGQQSNVITSIVQNRVVTTRVLRMLFKRLPHRLLEKLLKHRPFFGGTPLYAACTLAHPTQQHSFITFLLDAGADIEADGGEHGTPLMGACATGRLPAVKTLVQKQAKLSYSRDGQHFSALRAAEKFPEITQWLLVGRFREGPKLLTEG